MASNLIITIGRQYGSGRAAAKSGASSRYVWVSPSTTGT